MAVKLVVHRTYEVTLPDDKNYELKLDGKEYPFAELVTAAIDEFEAGRPNGMLLHVAGEPYVTDDGPVDAPDTWIHKKEHYAEMILRTCEYSVIFLGEVID